MLLAVEINQKKPTLYVLNKEEVFIGSHASNDIVISSHEISRKHLKIVLLDERCFLVDQGSTNGTYLNEERMIPGKREAIPASSVIRLGDKVILTLISGDTLVPEEGDEVEQTKEAEVIRSIDEKTRIISLKDMDLAKRRTIKNENAKHATDKILEHKRERSRISNLDAVSASVVIIFLSGVLFRASLRPYIEEFNLWWSPQRKVTLALAKRGPDDIIQGDSKVVNSRLLGRAEIEDYFGVFRCTQNHAPRFCKKLSVLSKPENGAIELEDSVLFYFYSRDLGHGELNEKLETLKFIKESLNRVILPRDYYRDFYIIYYHSPDGAKLIRRGWAFKGSMIPALIAKYEAIGEILERTEDRTQGLAALKDLKELVIDF
jgi:pSer/pThr/pTyr-binding forkhead associated (FHA) protein